MASWNSGGPVPRKTGRLHARGVPSYTNALDR